MPSQSERNQRKVKKFQRSYDTPGRRAAERRHDRNSFVALDQGLGLGGCLAFVLMATALTHVVSASVVATGLVAVFSLAVALTIWRAVRITRPQANT